MPSKKTVTPNNLSALGADRLAAILMELADGNAEIKRRLRLELAAEEGGDSITAEIGKRLTALRSARSFIEWQKLKDFVRDLDQQRAMIADRVAPARPDLALELMWRFLDLADLVFARVDDSNGTVSDVFQAACEDLGVIAARARPDPAALAERVCQTVLANEYGVYDNIIPVMLPALGDAGASHVKARLSQIIAQQLDARAEPARHALQDLADGLNDVDGYIALVPAEARSNPHRAAEIGRRLLAAGRAVEALAALEAGRPNRGPVRVDDEAALHLASNGADHAWEAAFIAALEATGRQPEAQRHRWNAFATRLSATYLRDYLKRLPDFDDIAAEERAMQHALGFASFDEALHFFIAWPEEARAAELVLARTAEIDGNRYDLLDPAARLMEAKHPIAATLLRRAMIEHTLNQAKSTRYQHAARHLLECAALAPGIQDFGDQETHESFISRLQASHGRKAAFWGQFSASDVR
jgi:hypothetical protein